ncbi:MAG: FtsH protease activity modulator HflK [Xanthomonadaceae bacterium]|nr:FtsH protease activity modulator HflK [Xanthomonadaceae bacterium]MDE2055390.1 FtsH protease activity modulator HflK [Xanthomonadaceae bacterium]
MPWKEPGEKPREPREREPRGREPWGQGGQGPDLDAWARKFRRGLGPFGRGPLGFIALVVLLIVLWFVIGGWTSVGAQQVGVLLRFGRFERVLQPGPHLRLPPPIDRIQKIDIGRTRAVGDEARVLTSDGQLVLVDYDVHYKITDVRRFLFATRDAEQVVRDAATAAARAAVGSHELQCLIDDLDLPCPPGRIDGNKLGAEILAQVQGAVVGTDGDIGAAVTGVDVRTISVPSDVKQAFDAISAARDSGATAQAGARAEVASSKLKAKDQAASIKTDAEAHRRQAVAEANAAVARFGQILPQYQAAPQVTRHRLWLDTMRDVLTRNHVVVNTGSGNVIVQFPVQHPAAAVPASSGSSAPAATSAQPAAPALSAEPVTSGPTVDGID